jgi:hypothetical protein
MVETTDMGSTRSFTVGEGDDCIQCWKPPFDRLFEELWSGVERARQCLLDLPWEDIVPVAIGTQETRKALIDALRLAEIEYEHDEVFWTLSPGASITSTEWESGGPMSGVYKKARIPTSERKQAIKTLEAVVAGLRTFWSSRE